MGSQLTKTMRGRAFKALLVYILIAPLPPCLFCSKALLQAFLPCLVSPIGPLLCAARKAALMDFNEPGCYSSPNWSRSQLWHGPKSVKLNGTTVTLPTRKGNIRGWFLRPTNTEKSPAAVLYLHGISATRAYAPRVATYHAILAAKFPVLAIDYRGFGDSSDVEASETTMVEDSTAALRFLQASFSQVIIWGHSLGAAVVVALATKVSNENGLLLVLESPFTKMIDAGRFLLKREFQVPPQLIDTIPLGKLAKKADISFRSDLRLGFLQLPTLILHAEDDETIPYQQGRDLYGSAVKAGKRDIRMVTFAQDLGCAHSFISKNPQLPALIRKFYNGQMAGPMLSRVTGKENYCTRTPKKCTPQS